MPPFHFWFTGAALGSFLALIATVSSLGYAWYTAAANEQEKARSSAVTEQEKARLKIVRERLQDIYVKAAVLLNRNYPKGTAASEIEKYSQEFNAWATESFAWIEANLGTAAAARLADVGSGFNFRWDRAVNEQHNNIINLLTKYRENLAKLIESNAWDAGEKK